jgi:hypothetical protein
MVPTGDKEALKIDLHDPRPMDPTEASVWVVVVFPDVNPRGPQFTSEKCEFDKPNTRLEIIKI